MNKYGEIQEIIAANLEDVNFSSFGDGVAAHLIARTEMQLGVKLPPSYIWWLENYRGGEIYGNEIFSIYDPEIPGIPAGDIGYRNELSRKDNLLSADQLEIMTTDFGEVFYFDLLQKNQDEEYPVYVNPGNRKYATDFLDFLKKQILE